MTNFHSKDLFLFGIVLISCDEVLETPGAQVFSNAKAFKAVSFPDAGHGLNLHLNATGAFEQITTFLSDQGL